MQIEPKEWLTRKESTLQSFKSSHLTQVDNVTVCVRPVVAALSPRTLYTRASPHHQRLPSVSWRTTLAVLISPGTRGKDGRVCANHALYLVWVYQFVCLLSGQPKCISQIFIFKFLISDFIALFIFHPWCANLLFLFVYFLVINLS